MVVKHLPQGGMEANEIPSLAWDAGKALDCHIEITPRFLA